MATHSSVLAWRIPWTEEPGGLPSMGSHRVGHDCSNLAAAAASLRSQQEGLAGGPVIKTPCSQCRRPRFDPWSGNCMLQLRPVQQKKKKKPARDCIYIDKC